MDKNNAHILVVDDEAGMRDLLTMEFESRGYRVTTACDGAEAVEKFQKEEFQLVVSDVKMPRMDGIAALEAIKNVNPDVEVIITTGFGSIDTAVAAMKKGAYDFVQKPFNLDEIMLLVEKALEKSDLKALLALYESSKAIFSAVKLDQLFDLVTDLVQRVLRADECSVMLLDTEKKLYIAARHGLDKDWAPARLRSSSSIPRITAFRLNSALFLLCQLSARLTSLPMLAIWAARESLLQRPEASSLCCGVILSIVARYQ